MKKQIKQTMVILALLAGIQLASAQPTFIPYSITGFSPNTAAIPFAGLVQASNGYFYGTTYEGGLDDYGVIFEADTNGNFSTIYSFTNGHDGANPKSALMQASDGNLYGTSYIGGTNHEGSFFRITTSGPLSLTPLHSFTGGDGANPESALIQASDGNLYGTTYNGGTSNVGTVFRITTSGALTRLYSFTNGNSGANPSAGLVQASDGNLYGTTEFGSNGASGFGVVFRITTNGALTPLHSFTNGFDGAHPLAALVQASDGNLYGTTADGGFNPGGNGTVFRITTNGALTTLYVFTGGYDGSTPDAALVLANDGNLYGTTYSGGTNSDGTVFRITTTGVFTSLHSFAGGDGANPLAALIQANSGNLFGTTEGGGSQSKGTLFEWTLPSPSLNMMSSGNQSVFFWPAWAPNNYVLQSTTNLASTNWVTVSNAVPVYAVTATNSAPAQYFRLAAH